MSLTLRHGELSISLPNGWTDQSTLLFLGPPTHASLPTLTPTKEPPAVVSVRFLQTHEPDPREVLADECRKMQQLDPTFAVLSQGPFQSGLGEGWHLLQKSALMGSEMRQLVVCFCLERTTILASAAVGASSFDEMETTLRGVLESLDAQALDVQALDPKAQKNSP